ncbi:MAG: hypothetical protein R2688_08175 [Fimbriimonadaceae bacterium]
MLASISQLAGIEALKADPYYAKMASKTVEYRELLTQNLNAISEVQVIPSVSNFVLARLASPLAQELCDASKPRTSSSATATRSARASWGSNDPHRRKR